MRPCEEPSAAANESQGKKYLGVNAVAHLQSVISSWQRQLQRPHIAAAPGHGRRIVRVPGTQLMASSDKLHAAMGIGHLCRLECKQTLMSPQGQRLELGLGPSRARQQPPRPTHHQTSAHLLLHNAGLDGQFCFVIRCCRHQHVIFKPESRQSCIAK